MIFSKEAWWEYMKEENLSDIKDETVLYVLEQVFYLGYISKESEIEIIDGQLDLVSGIFK